METVILEILETAAIAVSGFLIKKYVFLEPDMEEKKQKFFYLLSFFLIGIVFLAFGKDMANMTALLMIGLNICLGRKKHRLCGLIQMLPFPGIINGLFVPTMLVPPYFFALSAQETVIYQFILYGVLSMLLLLFYMKGKSWRSWFQDNIQHRSLRKSEKYLLWIIGILMLLFSNHTTMQITVDSGNVRAADSTYGRGLAPFIGITSVSAFVMTITIIVLIMQGNKRSFYHEKVSRMQSGMITFMAEVVENRDDNTVEMVAYHHEWWNGKGYPYGISGEEIPLCARIMAVADVFDALTSKRCYKNAMPLEKAYAIIREESGTHFDPAVVEAFFAVTADMEEREKLNKMI